MDNQFIKNVAAHAPIILISLSIGGLLFGGVVLSRWDYSIRGLAIAVPFIISAILLRFLFSANEEVRDIQVRSNINHFQINSIFIVIYLVSLASLMGRIAKEWYLITVILLYITIFFKVFFTRFNINIVLCGIVLTMANIIYGVTFYYPLYFRSTDVMGHIFLAKVTYLSGHIIPLDLEPAYSSFPLYHIFIAECSNILNLPIQETLFLITCPIFVLTVLFVYKIFSTLSHDPKVSALGCIFFSMSGVVLTRGIEMVTSVTAFVGFCILIYLIVKAAGRIEQRRVFQGLAIILSLFIILVHQVSVFLIVALIVTLILSEIIINSKKIFSNYFIFLILAILSGYWIYSATVFTYQVLSPRLNPDVLNLDVKQTFLSDPALSKNIIAFLFLYNNISISILAVFVVTGIIYMIWRQKPKYLAVIGMFLLFTLVLYVPNPLSTTEIFTNLFRIDRFLILLSPFVAFAMGYGFILTYNLLIKKNVPIPLVSVISIIIILVYIITSVPDVVLTESSGTRLFFDSQELDGFNFVLNNVPYGSELQSDYYVARFFIQRYFTLTDALSLPYFTSERLGGFDDSSNKQGYSIIREEMFEEDGLRIEEAGVEYKYLATSDNRLRLNYFIEKKNKIYYSDSIAIVF